MNYITLVRKPAALSDLQISRPFFIQRVSRPQFAGQRRPLVSNYAEPACGGLLGGLSLGLAATSQATTTQWPVKPFLADRQGPGCKTDLRRAGQWALTARHLLAQCLENLDRLRLVSGRTAQFMKDFAKRRSIRARTED